MMQRKHPIRRLALISLLSLVLSLALPACSAVVESGWAHGTHQNRDQFGSTPMSPFSLSQGSNTFYFAEGTTRPGFEEWLTIQNPNDAEAELDVVYMRGDGTSEVKEHTVAPNSRKTISVNSEIGSGDSERYDVSIMVESIDGLGIIAERPIYFDYQGTNNWGWTGGHDVIGQSTSVENWVNEEGKRIDDQYFWDVSVIQLDDGTYRMYGEKENNIKSYTSTDGLSWQREEGIRMANGLFRSS